MAESKLAGPIKLCRQQLAIMCLVYSACVQYARPWPHSDIRSCCRQSAHVFNSRYDSTLLGRAFFTPKVFWMRSYIHLSKRWPSDKFKEILRLT